MLRKKISQLVLSFIVTVASAVVFLPQQGHAASNGWQWNWNWGYWWDDVEIIWEYYPDNGSGDNGNGSTDDPPKGDENSSTDDPPADNGNGSTDDPPADNGNGSTDDPPADNGNGSTDDPPADNGKGTPDDPPADNGNGSTDDPPADNGKGTPDDPPADNGNGSTDDPPADNGNGSTDDPPADNGNGSTDDPSADNGNGSTDDPPADNGNGSTDDPPADNGDGSTDDPSSTLADQIIQTGEQYLGTPYEYGADEGQTRTFDCSSFVQHVFQQHGINLPRSSRQQATVGTYVSKDQLKKGDLLFFTTSSSGSRIGHVGIYAGNNQILHTYGPGGVRYDSLSKNWLERGYVKAKRVIN